MSISLPNGSSRNIISWNGFIPCCCFWSVTFFGTELHQTTSGYKNRVRIQAPRVVSIIAGKPKTASFPYENWRFCHIFSLISKQPMTYNCHTKAEFLDYQPLSIESGHFLNNLSALPASHLSQVFLLCFHKCI